MSIDVRHQLPDLRRHASWPGKKAPGQQAGMGGLTVSMIRMGASRRHGARSLRSPGSADDSELHQHILRLIYVLFMPSQGVLATKVANALIPDAASPIENVVGSVGSSMRRYRNRHGGLWVGGRVTLTVTDLGFSPNVANRLMHQGDPSFTIPLSAIRHIDVEPAFFTKIIAVTWTGGVARFRCYGAAKFADQIRAIVSSPGQR